MRRRTVLTSFAVVLVAGLAFGLFWFQPWKLFVDHRVDEALPSVATGPVSTTPATAAPSVVDQAMPPTSTSTPTTSAPTSVAPPPTDVVVARGSLITHEHDTSGTVAIVRLANGDRVLTLRDLDTSDGPDVEVWLTDAPVLRGEKGWYVFDDGAHLNLGDLKGNQGNQVYKIPRGADLSKYTSVSLWCARFDVSFGAAELRT